MNPELLQKYIAGNATEAEKQRVTEWIQENPENMREYINLRFLRTGLISLFSSTDIGISYKFNLSLLNLAANSLYPSMQ